jgi:uncharacterized membrane protein YebE (DUF533 family)
MAGFGDLLGALLEQGMSPSARGRLGNALGQGGQGGLGGMLGEILGGRRAPAGNAPGGIDGLGGLLEAATRMFGNRPNTGGAGTGPGAPSGGTFGGNPAGSGGFGGKGVMAVLAGLALQALLKGRGGNVQSAVASGDLPLGLRAPENEDDERELERGAQLALRAMLNAAKADGEIDAAEIEKISGKASQAGAGAEAEQFLREEMLKPMDLDGLVAAVPNGQMAAQVYAASLFAIEVDTPQEADYLRRLAAGLGLESGVVGEIHRSLGVNI